MPFTTEPVLAYRNGGRTGMKVILNYLERQRLSKPKIAYMLATVHHETAGWNVSIREGAIRYGKNYTDAQAQRAVAALKAKGIIRENYALPAGPYKQSYYGRGLVQLTHYDNYLKFEKLLGEPLTKHPDLVLDEPVAREILLVGMRDGLFRKGKDLSIINRGTRDEFIQARGIINGDVGKIGPVVADIATKILACL